MSIDVEDLEKEGYQFEFEYGEYDYSWNITKVFTKDGRVFELNDGGCSCYGFGEGWADVHAAIGSMYEVTSLPEITKGYSFGGYSKHGTSIDDIRSQYRELGIH